MAMEMVCGNCQGRLMVEQTGVVVACPHCGAHLQIGDIPPPAYYPQQDFSQPQYPQNYPPQNFQQPNFPPQHFPQPHYPQPNYPPQNFPGPNYPYPNYPQQFPQQSAPPSSPEPTPPPVPAPESTGAPDWLAAKSAPIPELKSPEPDVRPSLPAVPEPSVIPVPPLVIEPANPETPITAEATPVFKVPPPEPAVAESETWLPKIDTSMPEPIKSARPETSQPQTSPFSAPDFQAPRFQTPDLPASPFQVPAVQTPGLETPAPEKPQSDSGSVTFSVPSESAQSAPADVAPPKLKFGAAPPVLPAAESSSETPPSSSSTPPAAASPPITPVLATSGTSVASGAPAPTEIWNAAQLQSDMNALTGGTVFKSAPAQATTESAPTSTPVTNSGSPDFASFGGGAETSSSPFGGAQLGEDGGTNEGDSLDADSNSQSAAMTAGRSAGKPAGGVPWLLFVLVLSYSSAITIAYLILYLKTINGSTLDLPDRRVEFRNGKAGVSIYPDGKLPASHRLKLGESRQYGSLKITPLKVTRGQLQFVHLSGNPKLTKAPSFSPVLKLWMKFENVSPDQTFPALDEELLYTTVNDRQNNTLSNNYLCLEDQRVSNGKKIRVYEWPIDSEWLMKGQSLDTDLKPGDAWETYIPSNDEQEISTLQGPIAWRVHFRKGYNRSTLRGVTTVVEVEFDSKDIQADS